FSEPPVSSTSASACVGTKEPSNRRARRASFGSSPAWIGTRARGEDMKQRWQRNMAGVGRSAAVALGLVMLGGAFTRGDGREDLAPEKVHIELGLLATAVGSATYPSGSIGGDLTVGESQVWSLVVGLDRYRLGGPAACTTNTEMSIVHQRRVPVWAAPMCEARHTVGATSIEKLSL